MPGGLVKARLRLPPEKLIAGALATKASPSTKPSPSLLPAAMLPPRSVREDDLEAHLLAAETAGVIAVTAPHSFLNPVSASKPAIFVAQAVLNSCL